MIPYGQQFIDEDDIKAVVEVLKGDWLTCGPKVAQFEEKVANYCGAKYAVAVSSGTTALSLAYAAAGITKGDEVITTPLTFAATSNTLVHLGAKPVFVDIDKDTLNIDPLKIEEKITDKTKAIAIVDFAGLPCDIDKIKQIADRRGLLIIKDGAHSLGAEYKGKKVGSLADLITFSFHPVKLICAGEGGMVLTDNEQFYEKMKILRHHGVIKKPEKGGWYYEIEELGYNFRITDFQCALGISQMNKIGSFLEKRRAIASKYQQVFSQIKGIILPTETDNAKSAWHIYPVQFNLEALNMTRKEVFDYFRKEGIGVQVHYMPLHLHPFYQKTFGYKLGDFSVAEKYYSRAITLPLFPKMTGDDVNRVIEVVKGLLLNKSPEIKLIKEKNDFIFKYQKQDVNEKLANILGDDFRKYRQDFEKTQNYLETGFVPDFPITVSLELVNRCNLNCIMCYKAHHHKPMAQLPLDVLEKVMNECKENKLPSLILGLGSEPLVYKDIDRALEIIKSANISDIFFGTNGVLLNDQIIEWIIKNKISRVEISLDAATKETYNKVRRVPVFDRVEENIKKLIACKKKYNQVLPVIRLCFVVMDINKHETKMFIEKWKDEVDYIDFQRCVDFSKIDKVSQINPVVIKNAFCSYPFYSLNIWSDGSVGPCCSFYGRKLVFGNAYKDNLKDIWDSDSMKQIREEIALKKFNPICQKCLYFRDRDLIDQL